LDCKADLIPARQGVEELETEIVAAIGRPAVNRQNALVAEGPGSSDGRGRGNRQRKRNGRAKADIHELPKSFHSILFPVSCSLTGHTCYQRFVQNPLLEAWRAANSFTPWR